MNYRLPSPQRGRGDRGRGGMPILSLPSGMNIPGVDLHFSAFHNSLDLFLNPFCFQYFSLTAAKEPSRLLVAGRFQRLAARHPGENSVEAAGQDGFF